MKKLSQPQPKTYISTTILFVLLLLAWFVFSPAQFGGRAVYLVISGISMEPTFYTGDLVVLHKTDSYQIGDIAAYHHPAADGIIIHRIVGQEDGRFVLLGDNKPYIDDYKPTVQDMVGRYWLHIPAIGNMITYLKSLGLLSPGIIIAALVILLIPSFIGDRKKKSGSLKQTGRPGMDSLSFNKMNKMDILFFFIVLAALSLLLIFWSFRQSLAATVDNEITYEQQGAFSYTADAPPGIYNANVVNTGKPLFLALLNKMDVNFNYQLVGDGIDDVQGVYQLNVQLSHPNGWDWTLELLPETPFSGDTLNIGSKVDLAQIQTLIDNLEQQTGLQGQRYTVAIVPKINVVGTLNGLPFEDEFLPSLAFDFDKTQMQLADSKRLAASSEDPLNPTKIGTIAGTTEVANEVSLFGFSLTITRLRQIAVIGLIISVGGLLWVGFLALRGHQEDEATQIQSKYNTLIINVQENTQQTAAQVIEVETMADLAKLAEREGSMILHYADGACHYYGVKSGEITYSYQVSAPVQSQVSISEGTG